MEGSGLCNQENTPQRHLIEHIKGPLSLRQQLWPCRCSQYSMFHKTKKEEVVRETLSVRRRGTCREEDTCPERCKGELREEMQFKGNPLLLSGP